MQLYFKYTARDTGSLPQQTHHQYAIEGFGTPKSKSERSNVSTALDLAEIAAHNLTESNIRASSDLSQDTFTSSESTQQHSTKAPSTPVFYSPERFAPFISSSKQIDPFLSASKQNVASDMLSTALLSGNRRGDIGCDKQQQTCGPTSALAAKLFNSTLGVNLSLNMTGEPSDLMLEFTPVNPVSSSGLWPALLPETQQNFQAPQLVLNEQQRHTELSNFAIADFAADKKMESDSSSRFPSEVDAFTQSYQFAPILPTFSRMAHLSPSDASQLAVNHQLPSDFLSVIEDKGPSSNSTEMEDVRSDIEAPLDAAEPLVGLGISFGELTPGYFFDSPTKALRASFRRVALSTSEINELAASPSPSTTTQSNNVESSSKEQGNSSPATDHSNLSSSFTPLNKKGRIVRGTEGSPSMLASGGVAASPLPSTATQNANIELNSNEQQKSSQCNGSSNVKSGFTPLAEQGKATHDAEESPAYKIRTNDTATKMLSTPAKFGPPLNYNMPQREYFLSKLSAYGRATAYSKINYSKPYSDGKPATFIFLTFDQEHVEMLLRELEQLKAEELKGVQIRMYNYFEGQTAHQQALTKERLLKHQKEQLKMYLKWKDRSMILKAPEGQRLVKFRPLSLDGAAKPEIMLTVLPAPLTEFLVFKQLPPELRQRIWEFSLPGPRTVFLTSPKGRPSLEFFQPKSSPPAILQVCAQARAVALRYLEPAFENPSLLQGARTFFNFSIDTLRLTSGLSIETARAVACAKHPAIVADRERIRHLEIPFHIGHNMQQYHSLAALIILAPKRGWPGLKTLIFPGCPRKCRGEEEDYRMPIIEVPKEAKIDGLMRHISYEFRNVWEEFKDKYEQMPDTGLMIVYLETEVEE